MWCSEILHCNPRPSPYLLCGDRKTTSYQWTDGPVDARLQTPQAQILLGTKQLRQNHLIHIPQSLSSHLLQEAFHQKQKNVYHDSALVHLKDGRLLFASGPLLDELWSKKGTEGHAEHILSLKSTIKSLTSTFYEDIILVTTALHECHVIKIAPCAIVHTIRFNFDLFRPWMSSFGLHIPAADGYIYRQSLEHGAEPEKTLFSDNWNTSVHARGCKHPCVSVVGGDFGLRQIDTRQTNNYKQIYGSEVTSVAMNDQYSIISNEEGLEMIDMRMKETTTKLSVTLCGERAMYMQAKMNHCIGYTATSSVFRWDPTQNTVDWIHPFACKTGHLPLSGIDSNQNANLFFSLSQDGHVIKQKQEPHQQFQTHAFLDTRVTQTPTDNISYNSCRRGRLRNVFVEALIQNNLIRSIPKETRVNDTVTCFESGIDMAPNALPYSCNTLSGPHLVSLFFEYFSNEKDLVIEEPTQDLSQDVDWMLSVLNNEASAETKVPLGSMVIQDVLQSW